MDAALYSILFQPFLERVPMLGSEDIKRIYGLNVRFATGRQSYISDI